MEEKWIKKYMRFAKIVGEDQNPCYSRQIGCVIVNPLENRVVGTGYNGPPRKLPHCDTKKHLELYVWPQLTDEEKLYACGEISDRSKDEFLEKYTGCKTCPRRIIGAKSGYRLELCTCAHAEANAIINSNESLRGCWMFCWCGRPCSECTKLIINKQIDTVVCLDRYVKSERTRGGGNDYDGGARVMIEWGGINVIECDHDELLSND